MLGKNDSKDSIKRDFSHLSSGAQVAHVGEDGGGGGAAAPIGVFTSAGPLSVY